jgi:hypothetical protein
VVAIWQSLVLEISSGVLVFSLIGAGAWAEGFGPINALGVLSLGELGNSGVEDMRVGGIYTSSFLGRQRWVVVNWDLTI